MGVDVKFARVGSSIAAISAGVLSLALGVVAVEAAGTRRAVEELSDREAQKLVESYFEIDARGSAGCREQDQILAQLEAYPPLGARAIKSWRKKIDKLWSRGPKLEKKSGRHYLWEKEKRGLYIVGGEERRPKALFIGMHGGGKGSGDAYSSHGSFSSVASKEKWLAIFPEVLEKTERGWTTSGTEEFVLELVERALRTWKLDPDRVYLGGHSMGGYGTWTLGAHHADQVAALTASAGAPTPVMDATGIIDIEPGIVPNLRNVPIVIYQSDDDPNVPPDANRMGAKRLEEAKQRWGGFPYEYWEVTGRGHAPPPGGMRALFEKIRDERREARPQKIVWQPTLSWKRQFYWLWWERPELGRTLVAELDREANSVSIESDAVMTGLSVLFDDDLLDLEREVAISFNGDEVFRGPVEHSLAVLLATGVHGDGRRTYTARVRLVER